MGQCIVAQLGEGVGASEGATSIVEIEPALARRRIIERFTEGREVGEALRQRVEGRSCARRSKLGFH